MDISLVIKNRLDELGLEQRDLAFAAEVTESYISQLLTRKKAPPAPNKTDIYNKMSRFSAAPSRTGRTLEVVLSSLRTGKCGRTLQFGSFHSSAGIL